MEFTAPQDADHGGTDRRGQRIAAERRSVLTGMKDPPEDVAVGHHRGQRNHAAAECLAEQIDIGHHTPMVTGEGVAGAGQAGLDLVGDQQDIAPAAQCAQPGR